MRNIILKIIINIITFVLVVYFVPGIWVDSMLTVIVAVVILTLINVFLKPLILIFTLPFNIVSLGLFTLIINGFIFYVVSKIVPGFSVSSFWNAVWCALIFSVISFFLNLFTGSRDNVKFKFYNSNKFRDNEESTKRYKDVIDVEVKEKKDENQGIVYRG